MFIDEIVKRQQVVLVVFVVNDKVSDVYEIIGRKIGLITLNKFLDNNLRVRGNDSPSFNLVFLHDLEFPCLWLSIYDRGCCDLLHDQILTTTTTTK